LLKHSAFIHFEQGAVPC